MSARKLRFHTPHELAILHRWLAGFGLGLHEGAELLPDPWASGRDPDWREERFGPALKVGPDGKREDALSAAVARICHGSPPHFGFTHPKVGPARLVRPRGDLLCSLAWAPRHSRYVHPATRHYHRVWLPYFECWVVTEFAVGMGMGLFLPAAAGAVPACADALERMLAILRTHWRAKSTPPQSLREDPRRQALLPAADVMEALWKVWPQLPDLAAPDQPRS